MNPVRMSERIAELVAAHGKAAGVTYSDSAPLLTVPSDWFRLRESADYQESVAFAAFDPDTRLARLPFRRARVALPECVMFGMHDAQLASSSVSAYGVVEAEMEAIVVLLNVRVAGHDAVMRARILCPKGDGHHVRINVHIYARGEWSRVEAGQNGIASFVVHPVLALAWYYNAGTMQPVIVSPPLDKSAGRSAEWLRARSYYSVVHRRHAANSAQVQVGAVVGDKTKILTAHARRAHARILRSPKWGASMGKRVWVRSAWVGPKEWQDAESRQVYRVVDMAGGRAA